MDKLILVSTLVLLWSCAPKNTGNSNEINQSETSVEKLQNNQASPSKFVEQSSGFPYIFTAPEDWRSEVVTFPLSFAPELEYEGHGDVRFAPGMFKTGADDFWTYSFVWWLPLDTDITPDRLSLDMSVYFSGLADAIMTSRELDVPDYTAASHFEVSNHPNTSAPGAISFQGRVETLDAFATQRPVALNANVDLIPCPAQDHLALIFGFSPQPHSHKNWRSLNEIKSGFQCGSE